MQINENYDIMLASEGSGAFLSQISKTKLLETWEKSQIQYLNVIDLKNTKAKIIDPLTIGLMIERGYDCIADGYERQENAPLNNPCIMENKFHYFDLY
jgi:UDP-N-acetylglucosamine pyrophosphorylase